MTPHYFAGTMALNAAALAALPLAWNRRRVIFLGSSSFGCSRGRFCSVVFSDGALSFEEVVWKVSRTLIHSLAGGRW